jgi:hypothetical protein
MVFIKGIKVPFIHVTKPNIANNPAIIAMATVLLLLLLEEWTVDVVIFFTD